MVVLVSTSLRSNAKQDWSVYMILCSDQSLYTGISNDVERRFQQHLNKKGAKYFYSKKPLKIVYLENNHNRSSASQRECRIKKLTPIKKKNLLISPLNQLI